MRTKLGFTFAIATLGVLAACSSSSGNSAVPGASGAAGSGGNAVAGAFPGLSMCSPAVPPSVVFTPDGSDYVNAIAVDDTRLYVGAHSVVALPLAGGARTELYSLTVAAWVDQLTVAGANLFAAVPTHNIHVLLALPLDASHEPAHVAQKVGDAPFVDMGSDGSNIFYVAGPGGALGTVESSSPGGMAGATLHSNATTIAHIVLQGTDVFLATASGAPPSAYAVERGATSGGTTSVIATSTRPILALAVNGSSVFWSESSPSPAVKRANYDGSNVALIANVSATSLAADDASLFLTTDGKVVQVAIDSFQQTDLAQGQIVPSAVVQRGDRVYWINGKYTDVSPPHSSNAVMSACKQHP